MFTNKLLLLYFGIFAVEATINSYPSKTSIPTIKQEKVRIDFYYESLCPDCIDTYINDLQPTVTKLKQYLSVNTYPYGNAETIVINGNITFKCQHGKNECYGNKLHACAVKHFLDNYIDFNKCIIGLSSNDKAADRCGEDMNLNSELIKQCAKSDEGTRLLQYFGKESKKANFNYVPYILVNKIETQNLFHDVCAAFKNPPDACTNYNAGLKTTSAPIKHQNPTGDQLQ